MPKKKSENIEFEDDEIEIPEQSETVPEQGETMSEKETKTETAAAAQKAPERDPADQIGVDEETGEKIYNMRVDSGADPALSMDPDPQLPDLTPEQTPLVDAVINSWRGKNAALEAQLEALRKDLKEREGTIAELREKLSGFESSGGQLKIT
jgi:hypothetical protein